jgi:hypothetical protein
MKNKKPVAKKPASKKNMVAPPVNPLKEWHRVASSDVKYESFTMDSFLEWVQSHVPPNTLNEDIKFDFSVEEEKTYYDDIIITVEMNLYVRSEEWKLKYCGS